MKQQTYHIVQSQYFFLTEFIIKMDMNIQEFLDLEQRVIISDTVSSFSKVSLPCPTRLIEQHFRNQNFRKNSDPRFKSIFQIDPNCQILIKRLKTVNNRKVVVIFQKIVEVLINLLIPRIEEYKKEKTINYLRQNYAKSVQEISQCEGFLWKEKQLPQGSLWNRLSFQISQLFLVTILFLEGKFQLVDFPREIQLQIALQKINEKLSSVQNILSGINTSKEIQNQSQKLIFKDQDEIQVEEEISQIQQMENILQEFEQNQNLNDENTQNEMAFKHKSKIVSQIFCEESEEQIIPRQSISKDQDSQQILKLSQDEYLKIKQLTSSNQNQLFSTIEQTFNPQQKLRIIDILNIPFLQWQSQQFFITGGNRLVNQNKIKINNFKQCLTVKLSSLQPGERPNSHKYLSLIALFYRSLQQVYCTLAKRYLTKICQSIQNMLAPSSPYLRGALKIIQSADLKPTNLPKSIIAQTFKKAKLSHQIDLENIYQSFFSSQLAEGELLKFKPLNQTNPTKNVTFAISGFLSEKTDKKQEWQDLKDVLNETELYAVIWRSSSKRQLAKHIAKISGKLALSGINMVVDHRNRWKEIAKIGISLGEEIFNAGSNKKENPFWGALTSATNTGIFLADQLIQHFSDRHITLIGFSMGSEVIRSCVQHLAQRNKLDILLKVVTLGGVAHQDDINKMLDSACQYPVTWINFHSKRDYAVRYMYRVCTLGSKPIGSVGLQPVQGHQVINWEVGEVVKGHIDFRNHLRLLALIAGLHHE